MRPTFRARRGDGEGSGEFHGRGYSESPRFETLPKKYKGSGFSRDRIIFFLHQENPLAPAFPLLEMAQVGGLAWRAEALVLGDGWGLTEAWGLSAVRAGPAASAGVSSFIRGKASAEPERSFLVTHELYNQAVIRTSCFLKNK